jgi:hypothetical protein
MACSFDTVAESLEFTFLVYAYMPVNRPYRRTCRQFVDGSYAEGGRWQYIVHPKFSQSPDHYVRAFLILLKDVQELFDYIEPADKNLVCYSYRIHSLLLRACVEVEANCKAILQENGYGRVGDWNMTDYKKIEKTHFLSSYEVKIPHWTGSSATRTPFATWSTGGRLPWYQAYNTTKHDRHSAFEEATFLHLMDACCGLLVILSAQYWTIDFSPGNSLLASEGPGDGTESGIGGFFRVKFPTNMPPDLRYDFDWRRLQNDVDPFQSIDYSQVT